MESLSDEERTNNKGKGTFNVNSKEQGTGRGEGGRNTLNSLNGTNTNIIVTVVTIILV